MRVVSAPNLDPQHRDPQHRPSPRAAAAGSSTAPAAAGSSSTVAPAEAVDTRQSMSRLIPELPMLLELGKLFTAAGHEVALVGGPVRDAFLGRSSGDLDLTTSALPDETEAILDAWGDTTWDLGRQFGTIAARKGDLFVEVTTYRADAYDQRTRKPVVEFGDNLTDDLVRRDFTVNAMAVRLPELEFVDPHGGFEDLLARRLRTPSAPEVSFGDDPLRMMRAARFVSQLDFALDPGVREAMSAAADSLRIVSAERIRDEFTKLLLGEHPVAGLRVLVETGLADQMLPEFAQLRHTVDEHGRHKDVYEHSLTVLEQAIDLEQTPGRGGESDNPDDLDVPRPDLVLRLAAVLHDVGKPATRKFEPGGGVSFHHHEIVGAKMTRKRLRALRYDKDTVKAVTRLVELHLRFHGYMDGEWTDSAVRRYVTDAGPYLQRLHRLTRADCTTRNARKAKRLHNAYNALEERIDKLSAEEELKAIRPELNGNEIGELLGIAPGPVLGKAYKYALEIRMDQGPIGQEAVAEQLTAWWAQQPESRTDDAG